MPLRRLEPRDRSMVAELLAGNPYKQEQIDFQGLDRDRLARFHLERLMGRMERPDQPVWILESGGKTGVFGFQESRNQSLFFGKLVFTLDSVISYKLDQNDIAETLLALREKMVLLGAETIWAQGDEGETPLVQAFGRAGGDYCGASLRMSRWLTGASAEGFDSKGTAIRMAREGDHEELRQVARRSHRHSRFFRDPHLPEEKKEELFPDYLEKCLKEARRPCLVAVDAAGRISGFSLLLCPLGQEATIGRRVGIVDFIAVDPERQGGGVGSALLGESIALLEKEGYELVELKTQLDNRTAIGFYSRWGFRVISAELHFSFGKEGH